MNRKSKKIIIIFSIVLVIIIAVIIGMLFLATDVFKSPQQLFYKYVAQNSKFIEIFESDSYSLLEKKKSISPYTSQGEISIQQASESGLDLNVENTDNGLFKIVTEGKNDIPNKKQYNNITLIQSDKNLINIKYLRTGDKHALASDEIVTKYVAVENNNLKELFKKIGMSDEKLTNIPDKIESENIIQQIEFTQEEKKQILDKYSSVLIASIQKEKFSKNNKLDIVLDGQTYKANVYTLTLTNVEIKNIAVNALTILQNDDATLEILLNKYDKIANNGITLENLKEKIGNLINKINDIQLEKTENVSINLYINNGNLLKTEVVATEGTIELKYSTAEEKVMMTVKPSDIDLYNGAFDNLEIKKTETDSEYSLNITLNNVNNTQNTDSISLQISNAGNINSNNIRQLNILKISKNGEIYEIRQSSNLTFETSIEIEELNDENSVTINNYTEQELKDLITALQNRITQVIMEKMNSSGENNNSENLPENTEQNNVDNEQQEQNEQGQNENSAQQQEIDEFNEQFTPYLGESVQGEKVKTLLQNVKTAIQNGNNIKVSFSGVYNNAVVQKQGMTQDEIDEMLIYVILSKNYFVEGLADTTGKLAELTIKENT